MSLKRVLIVSQPFPAICLEILKKNVDITVLPYLDSDPEILPSIIGKLKIGYDGLIWNTKHRLTKELLDLAGPRLRAITTISSGLDHVDVSEVETRGIALGHTLRVQDYSVADIAVGLMIATSRGFKEGTWQVERGEWKFGCQLIAGREIVGSTVGIVGLGGIGQAIVNRLKGFDVGTFIYSGRTEKPEAKALGAKKVPQDQLFKESDYIVLACPLTSATKKLINEDSIKLMKETTVIINVGRGGLIDQEALYAALVERRIFAAGMDVTTPEPIPSDHPLVSLPNCYILPHLGCATDETKVAMATVAVDNILLALKGKPMRYSVV